MAKYEIKVHQLTPEPGPVGYSVMYDGHYLETFGTQAQAEQHVARCEAYDAAWGDTSVLGHVAEARAALLSLRDGRDSVSAVVSTLGSKPLRPGPHATRGASSLPVQYCRRA